MQVPVMIRFTGSALYQTLSGDPVLGRESPTWTRELPSCSILPPLTGSKKESVMKYINVLFKKWMEVISDTFSVFRGSNYFSVSCVN